MLARRLLFTWTVKTRWPITSQIDCSAPPTDPHLRLNDVLMLFCLIWTVRLWSTSLSRDSPNPNFPNRGKFSSALWVYINITIILCISLHSTLLVLHAWLTEAFSYVNRCECMPVSWLFSVMCAKKIAWVQSCVRKTSFAEFWNLKLSTFSCFERCFWQLFYVAIKVIFRKKWYGNSVNI